MVPSGFSPRLGKQRSARTPPASGECNATLEGMKFFLKAVVTGFGLSLGSALFKKVQRHLGLDDNGKTPEAIKQDGATDPSLQQRFS